MRGIEQGIVRNKASAAGKTLNYGVSAPANIGYVAVLYLRADISVLRCDRGKRTEHVEPCKALGIRRDSCGTLAHAVTKSAEYIILEARELVTSAEDSSLHILKLIGYITLAGGERLLSHIVVRDKRCIRL